MPTALRWLRRGLIGLVRVLFMLAVVAVGLIFWLQHRESHRLELAADLHLEVPPMASLQALPQLERHSKCRQLLRYNHAPQSGNKILLSTDIEDAGNVFTVDDEGFQRLSILVDSLESTETITLPSPRVQLFYSEGASAWVSLCAGSFADTASGTLQVHRYFDSVVHATIDLDLPVQDAKAQRPTQSRHVSISGWFTP